MQSVIKVTLKFSSCTMCYTHIYIAHYSVVLIERKKHFTYLLHIDFSHTEKSFYALQIFCILLLQNTDDTGK